MPDRWQLREYTVAPQGQVGAYNEEMQAIADQIKNIESVLSELSDSLPEFENNAANLAGSRRYRAVAERIVLASKQLQVLVKEHSFSR